MQQAAAAFLMAPHWPRAKLIVEVHGDILLSQAAIDEIDAVRDDRDSELDRYVQARRSVLAHAIRAGVPAAFAAQFELPPVEGVTTQDVHTLRSITTAQAMQDALAEQPALNNVLEHYNNLQAALSTLEEETDHAERLQRIEAALVYAWRAWDPELWTDLLWDLAQGTLETARDETALQSGLELGALALAVGPPPSEGPLRLAKLERNLGLAYGASHTGDRAGNLDAAIQYLDRAVSGFEAHQTPEMAAAVRMEAGGAWAERLAGDPAENFNHVVDHLTSALEVYAPDRYPLAWAAAHTEIGTAYFRYQGPDRGANLDVAKRHFDHALTKLDRDDNRELWTRAMTNSGSVFVQLQDGNRSENLLEAIRRFEAVFAVTDPVEDPRQWGTIHHNLGLAWDRLPGGERSRQAAKALEHFDSAMTVRTIEGAPAQRLDTLAAVAHLHFRERQWELAAKAYADALASAEELVGVARSLAGRRVRLPQISLLSTRMAFCLVELGRTQEAFLRLEAGKMLLLSAERAVLSLGPGRLIMLGAEPSDVPLAELLLHVPAGTAVVAPLITAMGSRAFVTRGGAESIRAEDVISLPDLDTDVLQELLVGSGSSTGWLEYQQIVHHPGVSMDAWAAGVNGILRRLWDTLMGPIAERLQQLGIKRGDPVLLLPHGGLGVFPLPAASDGRNTFLDAYAFMTAPSLDTLNAPSPIRMSPSLVVADPTDDLAYAALEAEVVGAMLGSEPVKGQTATVERVLEKARSAAIVHLACHGAYDPEDPFNSAVVLAAAQPLTWRRVVSELQLTENPLVTLSACETGVIDARELPDEVVGIASGFLLAGAAAVVSSLWAVDDAATALLMERFYANVSTGQDPARAMRGAQLWLRDASRADLTAAFQRLGRDHASLVVGIGDRPFANPFYWAAWTCMGAPQSADRSGIR